MENDWTEQVATIWALEGGPAFPAKTSDVNFKGMSLRDWFAGQALNAIVAAYVRDFDGTPNVKGATATAFDFADAMIAARKTGGSDV
jgi:hypothetical protein